MANIRLSPDELDSFATKLRKNSSQAQELAKSIASNIKGCADSWEGNKQKEFVSKFDAIRPTLDKSLPELIEDMAKSLNTIAENFRNADKA